MRIERSDSQWQDGAELESSGGGKRGVQPYPADFGPGLQIGAHSLAVSLLPPITARAGIGKQGVGQ